MKHLEPSQKPASKTDKPIAPSSISKLKLFLISTALVVGIGSGMTVLFNSLSNDNLSDAKKSELIAEFSKLKPMAVEQVATQDIDKAIDSMHLPPDQRQLLKSTLLTNDKSSPIGASALKPDKAGLVWISLWDFQAPDGDIVHVSSAGYEMDIPLQKLKNKIAVPVDESKAIKITGVRDGGGGITLAIQSGVTTVSMPVLQVGQVLSLPLSY